MSIYDDEPTEALKRALRSQVIGGAAKDKIRKVLAGRSDAGESDTKVSATPAAGSTAVGVMNKTEAAHAQRLEADPQVREYWYETVKVRSGRERSWLTPDFFVRYADGSFGFDEVKGGYVREDARAKFQAAALSHRWARWRLWQLVRGEWELVHDYPAESQQDRNALKRHGG